MIRVNENFLQIQQSYLFGTIIKKVNEYTKENPDAKIIKLGVGDVTRPIPQVILDAMHKAVDEMGDSKTFKGYGPEIGYDFLKEKIKEYDYKRSGIDVDIDEIFISDGINSDCGNIVDLFAQENRVAIADPVYPVYLDTNVMSGRSGDYDKETGKYKDIVYLSVTAENGFIPELPKEKVDMIYLCYPNNPTGTTLTRAQLKEWVDYARENRSIILFDAAYEAFVSDDDVPHSIYEIEGAKEVAIEFKSYSKTAGFTGLRCAYTIVPKEVRAYTKAGEPIYLNKLWDRRQCTKFNGASYVIQRGAEATYTEEGRRQILENINYYKENCAIIKKGLEEAGFTVYGGVNSPYVWLKLPEGEKSWDFFEKLLRKANVVGTPGVGFGPSGEGYFRLTGFGTKENTVEAVERIKKDMELILPEYAKYVYEINCLRISVAKVLAHRDALKYHICRYIELDYMLKVGALEYKQFLIENKVEKAKKMLHYLQEENAKPEDLPELIRKEFEEKDKKAKDMGEAINNAIDMSLEKIPTEDEITELNSYYLVLLRDYSPELNIKNSDEEKEMFDNIQKAYILCDLKAIKKYEKCKKEELFFDELEEYKKEKIRLNDLLSNTNKEIAKIKNTFPYTEKLSIQDENLFRRRKETINARTNELEDELKLLQKELRKF